MEVSSGSLFLLTFNLEPIFFPIFARTPVFTPHVIVMISYSKHVNNGLSMRNLTVTNGFAMMYMTIVRPF